MTKRFLTARMAATARGNPMYGKQRTSAATTAASVAPWIQARPCGPSWAEEGSRSDIGCFDGTDYGELSRTPRRPLSQRVGWATRMSANGGEHAWTAHGRISGSRRPETETGIETGRLDASCDAVPGRSDRDGVSAGQSPFKVGGGCGIRTREGVNPTRFPSERHRPLGESSARKVTGNHKPGANRRTRQAPEVTDSLKN
jgi:hypothetical protein